MTWSLRFLGVFEAGRARLAITPPQKTAAGWRVMAVGEAEALGLAKAFTGLHDDYRLVLDAATLAPKRIDIVETGYRSRTVTVQTDGNKLDILQREPQPERRINGVLPSAPLEPVAVLLQLRGARLKEGDHLELIILDGTALYQGTIDVEGREELTTAFGTHRAIKLACRGERIDINGRKTGRPPRTATLWLSDDPLRLPLLVTAQTDMGSGQFELTSHESGLRPVPIPKTFTGISERHAGAPRPALARPVTAPAQPAPGPAPTPVANPTPGAPPAPMAPPVSATTPAAHAPVATVPATAPAPGATPLPPVATTPVTPAPLSAPAGQPTPPTAAPTAPVTAAPSP